MFGRFQRQSYQYELVQHNGLEDSELIAERPDAIPSPVVEVREFLPDGTEFKAVWSHLRQSGVTKLVTVHFFRQRLAMRIPGERIKRTRLIQSKK